MLLEDTTLDTRKTRKFKLQCDECNAEILRNLATITSSRLKHDGKDLCKRCVTINYNKTRPVEIRKKAGQGFANKHKGKKLHEIVGEEKASEIRATFTRQRSGEGNVNYGGVFTRGFADRPLSGKWEDRYGDEKATQMKAEKSVRNRGEGNPMYGKPAPLKSGNGISGHYKDFYFRSLLELSYILMLEERDMRFESGESQKHKIEYSFDGRAKSYFPDFYLPATNEYIEIKPKSMLNAPLVVAKIAAANFKGIKLTIVTESDIIKLSKQQLQGMVENGLVQIDQSKLWRISNTL